MIKTKSEIVEAPAPPEESVTFTVGGVSFYWYRHPVHGWSARPNHELEETR